MPLRPISHSLPPNLFQRCLVEDRSSFRVRHRHGWTVIPLVVQAWFQEIRTLTNRSRVISHMPIHRSRSDLREKVAPRLQPNSVSQGSARSGYWGNYLCGGVGDTYFDLSVFPYSSRAMGQETGAGQRQ